MGQAVREESVHSDPLWGNFAASRWHAIVVCLILACYTSGRVLQVLQGPPANMPLVALEVLSAFALALVDGARAWGLRGILVFAGICTVVGNVVENIGVATGIPFGHYVFLQVMGPKLFAVPVLLGLAYIGMAYASLRLGAALVGGSGGRVLAVALVAAAFMTSWDVAQDPVWSTMLHAWAWFDGGPWFGVPLQNYVGWYLNVLLIFVLFGVWRRGGRREGAGGPVWPALALYLLCAAGNVLQVVTRYVPVSVDASGKAWRTADILAASALSSVVLMGGLAAAVGVRMRGRAGGSF